MDPPKTQQPTASPSPKKRPSTLLDAYEVECIRRELESLLLKQNGGDGSAAPSGSSVDAAEEMFGLGRRRSSRHSSIKNANPAPTPPAPPKRLSGGGTRLHLGKHAVKICSGAMAVVSVPAAGANGRRPPRAGYREVEKV
uniref:Uncharacterized protein n=1 Tax=Avena sativa TaxID=4498 RepID=A0ACD6ANM2_AVESA